MIKWKIIYNHNYLLACVKQNKKLSVNDMTIKQNDKINRHNFNDIPVKI